MRRIILLLTVAVVVAVMVVASAAPAFAANAKGKAWGLGANPELCEPYSDPGCGFAYAYGKK